MKNIEELQLFIMNSKRYTQEEKDLGMQIISDFLKIKMNGKNSIKSRSSKSTFFTGLVKRI